MSNACGITERQSSVGGWTRKKTISHVLIVHLMTTKKKKVRKYKKKSGRRSASCVCVPINLLLFNDAWRVRVSSSSAGYNNNCCNFLFFSVWSWRIWRNSLGRFCKSFKLGGISETNWKRAQIAPIAGETERSVGTEIERRSSRHHVGHHLPGFCQCGKSLFFYS